MFLFYFFENSIHAFMLSDKTNHVTKKCNCLLKKNIFMYNEISRNTD